MMANGFKINQYHAMPNDREPINLKTVESLFKGATGLKYRPQQSTENNIDLVTWIG